MTLRIDTTDRPAPVTVAPSREDPVVASVSEAIGGPLGDHADRAVRPARRWWLRFGAPAGILMLLTGVVFGLGMLKDSTCYQSNWNDGNVRYTHMCYSDLPYLYTGRGFAELLWPYDDSPTVRDRYPVGGSDNAVMEYPVGISYWAWETAQFAHILTGNHSIADRHTTRVSDLWGLKDVITDMRAFVIVNAIGFAIIAIVSAGLLSAVVRRRPWDAAAFALSPALALTGLINWDMCAVGFVAGALVSWNRMREESMARPLVTGVLIGLGTATKLYPLFLLGGIFVICVRRRRIWDFGLTTAAGLLAWVVADLPAYLSGPREWDWFWKANEIRGQDLGSSWLAIGGILHHTFQVATINLVSWAVFALWCLIVVGLGLRAPRTPRLAQLGYLVLMGFLLVNKVYSPQYVLWLLPIAVLARPRWRDQLIWQATEVLYFACVWWYLAGDLDAAGNASDAPFYWISIGVRMAGEIYLAVMVVRDMYHPELDPVAVTEDQDDAADAADAADAIAYDTTVSSNVVAV